MLSANSFYLNGRPRPFLRLRHRTAGQLHIIEDPRAVECMLLHGMYCGLQCSLIQRRVFKGYRFDAVTRNEAEDQLIVVYTLARAGRLAYLDNIHIVYHVHDQNSSACGSSFSLDRHVRVLRALAEGYEQLEARLPLSPPQRRALALRLSRVYFWDLGYVLLRQPGRQREALALFRRGLRRYPWYLGYWKTYLWAWLRVVLDRHGDPASAACTPH